ncbi:UTP--glucose-1-phosphate uridylyltransferase [Phycicoccus endophyticus]|uniref:UTP--glucose-1-phosphate uridylyltransferase n=1 Tax=Phycicoccus endophyticus TaxID=1690220 RepID=A0A7G9R2B7_9MICO|nr:UTP--glucose-1-phosphate uridylyltransferase [Phycicoccus endophyticus]NHI19586.1 UTP--glucose-1-phosphate uridylyltransferase [Phycicoccus endophyticus]QNN49742.1 UTP--glucose-1-phosphate uridylyltransferase [Phycicoccus endophyticus]GGL34721.1 UTP--glucose-1-phosphate uridylyltransferase [Phycicoccus endophyticus]
MVSEALQAATGRMREAGVDELAVRVFAHYHEQLAADVTGTIPEGSVDPLPDPPSLEDVRPGEDAVREALAGTVVVKLNGGLGTSMGVSGPKSALEVREGRTFLDVIAEQVLALRHRHEVEVPLLVMNSFRTREASLEILRRHAGLEVDGLPLDFLQSKEPKLRADDLFPVEHPRDPELEWCPPGHGDVFVALRTSGLLAQLRERGYRYLFLSNADNLGATCEGAIPAWMAAEGIPYVAEMSARTVNDRKGGQLVVRHADGRLVLRDTAAVVPGEEHYFQDLERHRWFHTNNLWVDLEVLSATLDARDGVLGLPVIVNRKTVDPTDPGSTPVIQLETAMGSAVEVFDGARALAVGRERFRPVKTTNELLLLRSDLYRVAEDGTVEASTDRPDPLVQLGSAYTLLDGFEARFPHGVPSLRECSSLRVEADVTFGADVVCVGDVHLTGEARTVPDGARLEGAGG